MRRNTSFFHFPPSYSTTSGPNGVYCNFPSCVLSATSALFMLLVPQQVSNFVTFHVNCSSALGISRPNHRFFPMIKDQFDNSRPLNANAALRHQTSLFIYSRGSFVAVCQFACRFFACFTLNCDLYLLALYNLKRINFAAKSFIYLYFI